MRNWCNRSEWEVTGVSIPVFIRWRKSYFLDCFQALLFIVLLYMQNLHCKLSLGKPLLEVCWFYMVIAQIALEPPPPSVKRENVGKKCPKPYWQALTYYPSQMWEKSAPNNPGKPLHPLPLTDNAHMETHFEKGFPLDGVISSTPYNCIGYTHILYHNVI